MSAPKSIVIFQRIWIRCINKNLVFLQLLLLIECTQARVQRPRGFLPGASSAAARVIRTRRLMFRKLCEEKYKIYKRRETSNFLPTNDISSVWLWRAHLFKHVYAQLRQTKVLLIFENDPVEQNLKMRWDDERVDSPGWTMFYESPSQCSQTGW